ncbi:MAG: hypothetical protein OEM38_04070 [Gammaproteobacteria bacterium]|nr:hypothetical protein [Gammaproteobacteria bacterium]
MTNEQLSLLLTSIKKNLDTAIDTADSLIVHDSRHKETRYVGKAPFPAMAAMGKKNPEEWKEYDGDAIALDVIRDESEELQKHIDALAL